ncbi:unnamed protein product [Cuscuta epithymum]|uniref:Integrase zinc-binding domain-containing protein n=1 Tax=Cuscuta epithymum TaxID=186058 RepID=A0AAV0F0S2_9ASTE|nr:unnamed protein product [Cuscuta epithymum]
MMVSCYSVTECVYRQMTSSESPSSRRLIHRLMPCTRGARKCAVKESYWWSGMKREIAEYISRWLTCQQVKAKHQHPAGLLQPLSIPEWKWEHVTMDFVVGLPRTIRNYDAVWVVVDRLTKSAHFLPINTTYPLKRREATWGSSDHYIR